MLIEISCGPAQRRDRKEDQIVGTRKEAQIPIRVEFNEWVISPRCSISSIGGPGVPTSGKPFRHPFDRIELLHTTRTVVICAAKPFW